LGTVGLLESTDDDDRWLDPLNGFGYLGGCGAGQQAGQKCQQKSGMKSA
jgi:hypothetical protein